MIIITDTASDILESEAKAMNIELIALSSSFEDETIEGNTEESFEKFYKKELPSGYSRGKMVKNVEQCLLFLDRAVLSVIE